MPSARVTGEDVTLRPVRADDIDGITRACQDPETQRHLYRLPSPYTTSHAEAFVTGRAATAWRGGLAEWTIADPQDDRYLGSLGVSRVDWDPGVAGLDCLVAPWARGHRLAARAVTAATDFVFHHGIGRVEVRVAPDNIAGQRTALAAGFQREAQLRSAVRDRTGRRVSQLLYSRIHGDPAGPIRSRLPDLPDGGLSDGVVRIRPRRPGDVDALFALENHEDVWTRSVPPVPPDRETVDASCRFGAAANWLDGVQAAMVITDAQTGDVEGQISLHVFSPELGEAMLSYSLTPQARGKGYTTRAVRMVSRWAFEVGFDRLVAGTAVDNTASQRVLERTGFTREGVERSRLPGVGGSRVDTVSWSLLPKDLSWTS